MADTVSTMTSDPQGRADPNGGGAVERAREAASEVAADARHEVASVARDARQQTMRAAHQTREQLRAQADDQARTIASSLRSISGQLTAMGDAPEAGGGLATDVAHQLASTAGRVADTLESGGVEGAMDDMRRFARNRPVVFLVGALGAGMVAGRLLRATDVRRLVDTAKDAASGTTDESATTPPGAGSPAASTLPGPSDPISVPAATMGRQP